jgi:hypothetical protein
MGIAVSALQLSPKIGINVGNLYILGLGLKRPTVTILNLLYYITLQNLVKRHAPCVMGCQSD